MRPRSLTGPILLILIGGVFLVHNLRPEMPLLELFARYWPFVLIAWGSLRLLEVIIWSVASRPLPRAGLAGWEWVLAILICLAGTTGDFAKRHWPHARIGFQGMEVFGEPWDYEVNASHPIGGAKRVIVENPRGNVRITGADTDEIKVGGRTTVKAFKKEHADKAHRNSSLEIVAEGDRIVVRNKQTNHEGPWRVMSDLEVTVPRRFSVEGRGRFGDFDILNIEGDVDIESDNAGVRLADIGGSVRVQLNRSDVVRAVNVSGGVKVDGHSAQDIELENIRGPVVINGSYSGDLVLRNLASSLTFETPRTDFRVAGVPGEVRIDLGSLSAVNVIGPIKLKTRSRDVELADFSDRLEVDLERGSLEVRPARTPVGKMDLVVRSADVELALPESAAFGLLAQVEKGEMVNDYGRELTEESRDDRSILKGPSGKDTTITVRADRGKVTISKAAAVLAEAPPPPVVPVPPKPPQVEKY